MKLFKPIKKLKQNQLTEIAGLCMGVAFLILIAVATSGANAAKVDSMLAVNHILPSSQGACVFHCNDTAYTLEALNPTVGGAIVTTVAPNTPVQWIWNAGSYGANTFSPVCEGAEDYLGSGMMCTVQEGSPNTNFGTCSPMTQYCTSYTDDGYQCVMPDPSGGCDSYQDVQTCNGYAWTTATGCGNADDIYGHACYGASGGITVTGGEPGCSAWPASSGGGYDGNYPASTLTLNAPNVIGTYYYYFCSNWLLHAPQGALSCLATPLTVVQPVSAGATSNSPVSVGQSATITFHADVTAGTPPTCEIADYTGTPLDNVTSCPTSANDSYTTQVFTLPGTYAYSFYYNQLGASGPTLVQTVNIVVNATSCPNGLNIAAYPSCTCPANQSQQPAGSSTCTPNPPTSCPNGLDSTTYPSCTCPANQSQASPGSPSCSCSDGLDIGSYPSCTCPVGQSQASPGSPTCTSTTGSDICTDISGTQTTVPSGCDTPSGPSGSCIPSGGSFNGLSCSCPAGDTLVGGVCTPPADACNNLPGTQSTVPTNCHVNADGVSCSANSGYEIVGSGCVVAGSVSQFLASPTRVRKGTQTELIWSTTNMAACNIVDNNGNLISSSLNSPTGGQDAIINQTTNFTLSCTDISGVVYPPSTVTVGIVPVTTEQ